MSLLFSVHPPQKSDISHLLYPSLEELLAVCRRYQARKQEGLKAHRSSDSEHPPLPSGEESQRKTSEAEEGPVQKRRRTLEGAEDDSSKTEAGVSGTPGPSKDDGTETGKKDKVPDTAQKQTPRTTGSIWGPRPPPDWVDMLARAIQTTITKVPK